MIKFPFSAPTLPNGRTLISVSSGFLEIRIPLGLPGFQGKVSPGPPCHHPPCWHHRGVPTPTIFCHIVLVPPAHWLPELRLCYSQKHRVQAAVLTLSWASRNSEGLCEDLHIPYSAGHFLGLNLHALCLSFSKLPGVPSFLPQTCPKAMQGTEILPKGPPLPIFLLPTLTSTLEELFPFCLFSFFFSTHHIFSVL